METAHTASFQFTILAIGPASDTDHLTILESFITNSVDYQVLKKQAAAQQHAFTHHFKEEN